MSTVRAKNVRECGRRPSATFALRVAAVCLVSGALAPVHAAGEPSGGAPETLSLAIGRSGVFRNETRTVYSIEYRFRESRKGLHTALLLGWNAEARYLNFSLGYSRRFGAQWLGMIATGPGVYSHDSPNVDLGSPFEILTRVEFARLLDRERQLGLRVSHISNAHVSAHNPGNESVSVFFAFPVGR